MATETWLKKRRLVKAWISPSELRALRAVCKKQGISVAQFIRQMIAESGNGKR